MILKSDAKFKLKLTCSFKYDMRNFVNFHLTTQKSEVFDVWAKKYRGVIFHDTEQWSKIWINPYLVVSNMTWGIGWTFIRALKVWKIVHWWALFFKGIYIMFRLEKFQRNYVSWHWRVMQNLKQNWLVAWKITPGICLIFMRAVESLKICTLMGFFCPKHIKI